jgi:hypothetical protein
MVSAQSDNTLTSGSFYLKETTTSIVFDGCAIADGLDLLPARLELQ